MIATEEEAKKKWCPFVRSGLVNGASVNRNLEDVETSFISWDGENTCLGSKCMMWRWVDGEGNVKGQQGSCGLAR